MASRVTTSLVLLAVTWLLIRIGIEVAQHLETNGTLSPGWHEPVSGPLSNHWDIYVKGPAAAHWEVWREPVLYHMERGQDMVVDVWETHVKKHADLLTNRTIELAWNTPGVKEALSGQEVSAVVNEAIQSITGVKEASKSKSSLAWVLALPFLLLGFLLAKFVLRCFCYCCCSRRPGDGHQVDAGELWQEELAADAAVAGKIFHGAEAVVESIADSIEDAAQGAMHQVQQVTERSELASNIVHGAEAVVETFAETIGDAAQGALQQVQHVAERSEVASNIVHGAEAVVETIGNAAQGALQQVQHVAERSEVASNIVHGAEAVVETIGNAAQGTLQQVQHVAEPSEVPSNIVHGAQAAVETLAATNDDAAQGAMHKVSELIPDDDVEAVLLPLPSEPDAGTKRALEDLHRAKHQRQELQKKLKEAKRELALTISGNEALLEEIKRATEFVEQAWDLSLQEAQGKEQESVVEKFEEAGKPLTGMPADLPQQSSFAWFTSGLGIPIATPAASSQAFTPFATTHSNMTS